MFGMNLTESLVFQNAAKNDIQQRFEMEISSGDSLYEIIDKIETYLNNGYIIYDLLDEDAKWWIDRYIG